MITNYNKNLIIIREEKTMKLFHSKTLISGVLTCLILASSQVSAATVSGMHFVGGCPESEDAATCYNPGQATVENVSIILGVDVVQVDNGFTVGDGDGIDLNPPATGDISDFFEETSGTWSVSNPAITHLAFKADGFFILAELDATSGEWSTTPEDWGSIVETTMCPAGVCNPDARLYTYEDFLNGGSSVAELSNVRAFSAVPVPAAVWLFGSALGALGWVKRRKTIAA
jgi:hypothetical protein